MPPALVKAHNELDKAVDAAYSKQNFYRSKTHGVSIRTLRKIYRRFIRQRKPKKLKTDI